MLVCAQIIFGSILLRLVIVSGEGARRLEIPWQKDLEKKQVYVLPIPQLNWKSIDEVNVFSTYGCPLLERSNKRVKGMQPKGAQKSQKICKPTVNKLTDYTP